MNPLRKLAGDTAIYGISSIVGRLLNYLLFPLHTLVFPTGDYGIITELYVFAAFLNIVYVFGLETAFFRFATRNKDNPQVYNTAVTCILIISLVLSGSLVLFDTALVNAMHYEGQEHFIWIFAGILTLDAIQAIPFARIRLEGNSKLFAKAKITGILTNVFINLFFLYFCYKILNGEFLVGLEQSVNAIYNPDFNLEYVFFANLVGSLASGLFLYKYFGKLRFYIDRNLIRPMLNFGYPIVFTGLALVTNEMLSRTALKYWLPQGFYEGFTNQQVLGIFGGVFKLAVIMNLGIQAFRYAAEPFFFSQSEKKDSPELFSKLLTWFVIFGCLIWIGITYNLDLLKYLLRNPDYRTGLDVVPFLLLAMLFAGINYNLSAWYKLIDKTYFGTYITITGALLTIVGNYLLIPVYGYHGSAYAGILAYGFMCILSFILSKKYNPFPYRIGKIFIHLIIASILIFIHGKIAVEGWMGLVVKNLIVLGYALMVFFIGKKELKIENT